MKNNNDLNKVKETIKGNLETAIACCNEISETLDKLTGEQHENVVGDVSKKIADSLFTAYFKLNKPYYRINGHRTSASGGTDNLFNGNLLYGDEQQLSEDKQPKKNVIISVRFTGTDWKIVRDTKTGVL